MSEVYLLGGLRTHIGLKNGIFKSIRPEHLGAELLKQVLHRFQPANIDEIICGNAVGSGGNITRLMALSAGVSHEVPCFTVDLQCASSMCAIDIAQAKIRSGQCDLIIAGGFESSSLQPARYYHPNDPRFSQYPDGYSVAQFSPKGQDPQAMLRGAEQTAQAFSITKQELDSWVLRSHRLAGSARDSHLLDDLIVPLFDSQRDEGIRDRISQRLLDRLPPLLPGGVTNAANSCLINDGAALLVLCSAAYLKSSGLQPGARIISACSVGTDPAMSPVSAIKAADKLLARQGLSYDQISSFEFNEAFAVIDVLFQREHPELTDRYNRMGGALAYGHPYGASGGIILLHLLRSLQLHGGGYGVASIAAAGGVGSALLLERDRS